MNFTPNSDEAPYIPESCAFSASHASRRPERLPGHRRPHASPNIVDVMLFDGSVSRRRHDRTMLDERQYSLLEDPAPAVLTTRRDGSAATSPVWFRFTDDAFEVV